METSVVLETNVLHKINYYHELKTNQTPSTIQITSKNSKACKCPTKTQLKNAKNTKEIPSTGLKKKCIKMTIKQKHH